MENRNQVILRALSEMARADGKVTDEEKALLLDTCLQIGASPEETEELKDLLGSSEASGSPVDLKCALPDHASRLKVMKILMTLSFIDGTLDFAEFKVIESKAKELGVNPDELESLRLEALAAAEEFQNRN
ncbi:MAG: hypothetical protein WC423_02245 [Vulcanimicrobiota bacterium]